MKQKRKQTIFTTEKQILDEIDFKKALSLELAKEMELLHKAKASHFKAAFELIEKGQFANAEKLKRMGLDCEERARATAKRYHRLIEVTIPKLSEALAAFRTETMPTIMQDYHGVVLGA